MSGLAQAPRIVSVRRGFLVSPGERSP